MPRPKACELQVSTDLEFATCCNMFLLPVPAPREPRERIGGELDPISRHCRLSQVHPLLISALNSNFLSLSPQPSPGDCFEDAGQLTL